MGGSRKKAVKFVATFFRWLKTAPSTCNTMTSVISLDGLLIDKQFVVGQQIGKGSFGVVHQAKDRLSGRIVAIKFESKNTPHAQLFNEFRVYRMLGSVEGVPKAICSGTVGSYNYLVMEMVGPTLERMFVYCNRKFSLKTVLLIGDAMVRRIERLHQMSHVHRDIKPENMAIGYYNYQQLYLLDFGLAKSYGAIVDGVCKHVKPKQGTSFTGTVRYSSINALQRMTTSRRDDIESLAYVMIYFLKGRLPWQQAARPLANHSTEKQRKERVLEMKLSMKVNDLCDGLPNEFVVFVNYCRQLRFEEKPNYSFLRRLFGCAAKTHFFTLDCAFDWTDKHIKLNGKI